MQEIQENHRKLSESKQSRVLAFEGILSKAVLLFVAIGCIIQIFAASSYDLFATPGIALDAPTWVIRSNLRDYLAKDISFQPMWDIDDVVFWHNRTLFRHLRHLNDELILQYHYVRQSKENRNLYSLYGGKLLVSCEFCTGHSRNNLYLLHAAPTLIAPYAIALICIGIVSCVPTRRIWRKRGILLAIAIFFIEFLTRFQLLSLDYLMSVFPSSLLNFLMFRGDLVFRSVRLLQLFSSFTFSVVIMLSNRHQMPPNPLVILNSWVKPTLEETYNMSVASRILLNAAMNESENSKLWWETNARNAILHKLALKDEYVSKATEATLSIPSVSSVVNNIPTHVEKLVQLAQFSSSMTVDQAK
jgi:hypothetical protein